jgi:hypothetical protein
MMKRDYMEMLSDNLGVMGGGNKGFGGYQPFGKGPETAGGGGGPMPIPEGGPGNWRIPLENQGGGGGPMPVPTGGPNWKDLSPNGPGGFGPGGRIDYADRPNNFGVSSDDAVINKRFTPAGTGGFHPGGFQLWSGWQQPQWDPDYAYGKGQVGQAMLDDAHPTQRREYHNAMPIPGMPMHKGYSWVQDGGMGYGDWTQPNGYTPQASSTRNTNVNYWDAVGQRARQEAAATGKSLEDYGISSEFGGPGMGNMPSPKLGGGFGAPPPQAPAQPQRQPYNFGQQPGFQRPPQGGGDNARPQAPAPATAPQPRPMQKFAPQGFGGGMNGGGAPKWQNAMGSNPQGRVDFLNKLKETHAGGNGFKWKF